MRRRTEIQGALLAASGAALVSAAVAVTFGAGPASAASRGLLPVPLPTSTTTTAAPVPTPRLTPPPGSAPSVPLQPVAPRPGQPATAPAPAPGTGSSESAEQTLRKYMTHHDDPTFRVGAHTLYVEHCRSAHCAHSTVTINTKYDGVVTYEFYVDVPPSPTPSK